LTRFTLVDLVILIAVVFAISTGYRRGFWLALAQYAGLVLGVVIGATLAPVLMAALNLSGAIRSLGAVLILIVLGAIGSSVGYWVGEPIRLRLLAHPHSGRIDSVAGAIFSALAVLSVSWFLGLSLANVPSPQLSSAIQRSAVLRALDAFAPRPPGFLSRVERIIAGVNFAPVFSGLEPLAPSPQALPTSVDTPGVRTAQSETLKIQGYGCGGIVFGSGYPVGPGLVLTNAHVVAGTQGTTVRSQSGRSGLADLRRPGHDAGLETGVRLRISRRTVAEGLFHSRTPCDRWAVWDRRHGHHAVAVAAWFDGGEWIPVRAGREKTAGLFE